MSLEQLRGAKDIDARTDVYAFGVILYEAMTGQPPFQAETLTELVVKIATTEPPAPKAVQPTVPTELERVIVSAMTKKREDRLPSLERFIKELEPFADEVAYRESVTRHAASLPYASALKVTPQAGVVSPHAVTVAGRVSEATGAAAAEALQGRLSMDDGGDPITLPVRRQPIALYAGIGVLLLGGAAAWGLSGGSGANDPSKAANVVKPRPAPDPSTEPSAEAPEPASAGAAAAPAAPVTAAEPAPKADPKKPGTSARPEPHKTAAAEPERGATAAAQAPAAAQQPPTLKVTKVEEPPAVAPSPAARPAARKPAAAAGWTPIAMPRRGLVGGLFGNSAQAARRKTMLQVGPPYRERDRCQARLLAEADRRADVRGHHLDAQDLARPRDHQRQAGVREPRHRQGAVQAAHRPDRGAVRRSVTGPRRYSISSSTTCTARAW